MKVFVLCKIRSMVMNILRKISESETVMALSNLCKAICIETITVTKQQFNSKLGARSHLNALSKLVGPRVMEPNIRTEG